MSNTVINIASRHNTVRAAVDAVLAVKPSWLDYNVQSANQTIKDMDRAGHHGSVEEVFVTDKNEVYYVFKCDIRIFHKFEPFISVMDNAPFLPVQIVDDTITIHTALTLPRDKSTRKVIKSANMIVA